MEYYSKYGFKYPGKEPQWNGTVDYVKAPMDWDLSMYDICEFVDNETQADIETVMFWEDYINVKGSRVRVYIRYKYWDADESSNEPEGIDIHEYKIRLDNVPEYVSDDVLRKAYLSAVAYVENNEMEIKERLLAVIHSYEPDSSY